ncbi:MAG: hypothetical protein Q4A50_07865 [Bacteroidales bacterium]|nr:hypothetical protein [Bacteroidales bacterium]
MMFFLVFIVSVVLVFLSVDAFILLKEWQSRIHIGRWEDRLKWQKAIEKKAEKWLNHTPTVKMTAQNRLILLDILKGKYRNATIQTWQIAGLLLGLEKKDAERYTKSHQYLCVQSNVLPEDFLLAYALKKHGLLDEEKERIVLDSCQKFRESGTIYYRPWVKHIRFVDTLGMVLPFLHSCGWDDLANRQLEEYDQALLQGVFPAHAYDIEKNIPLGVHDWGRGIGWYILGLIETDDMGGNAARILRLANALLPFQLNSGGFSCFMFNRAERMESSGTVLAGLLFLQAYRISSEKTFLAAAFRVEKALMCSTRRNGVLDNCQGDTYGIGYYSHVFSIMPFAQGLALKLSKELNQYTDENA